MQLLRKLTKRALTGKIALVRIDLNVEPGGRLDSYRLEAVVPTIRSLRTNGARVVLMSHRGHPGSAKRTISNDKFLISKTDRELSLKPFVRVFSKKLGEDVEFIATPDLDEAKRKVATSKKNVVLLENLRFWKGEEKNDVKFAKQLAALGDLYVNDAFAVSHRANASVAAIARFLPSFAGLLLEREIEHLGGVMKKPAHPVTLIVGGAKIADKVGVIEYFWKKTDSVLLGGGPANTFFAVEGLPMGKSLVDVSAFPFVRKYKDKGKIMIPVDSEVFGRGASQRILDIGDLTARWYANVIKNSKTVIWNGPMGLFEKKGFERGTIAIWKAILALAKKDPKARIVVGGGETVASLQLLKTKNYKLKTNIFLSTGGGAMLDFLSGKKLPGIVALED